MYIDHDIKIVFIHVPRTGGSSIKEALGLYDKIYKKDLYHMSAVDIPDVCKDYFKFAFVRNPWDRFVSLYFYNKSDWYQHTFPNKDESKIAKKYEFKDWLNFYPKLENVLYLYKDVQQVNYGLDLVDFVGRYENLQKDFDIHFGGITLEVINKTKHKFYTYYYDEESINKVYTLCKEDIDVFKYEYGE
jgi:hypothetical protein